MPKNDIQHSLLIVSASDKLESVVRNSLPPRPFMAADCKKSAASARRALLERYYDLVVIDVPLQGETGIELALDTAESGKTAVLMVTPAEMYEDVLEQVTDAGVLVVARPVPRGRIGKALRLLLAWLDKLALAEREKLKLQQRLEEQRLVGKAKVLLVQYQSMTEDEAHRYIGKRAMDTGASRKRIAERIIEELE